MSDPPRVSRRLALHPLRARSAILVRLVPWLLVGLCLGFPACTTAGVTTGLAWCGGVTDPAELPACRAAGFNAVRLDVPWRATPAWEGIDQFVAAAQAQGLPVILALQAASPPTAAAGPVDPANAAYLGEVKLWIQSVVEHFRGHPAVLGWMLPDEPEAALRLSDAGLQAFLSARYGDLNGLNRAWGTRFTRLTEVTADRSLALARRHPLGVCPATIDVALYRQQGFTRLMQLWARYVRGIDPDRPLFTGAMGAYRCLISIPEEYAAVNARLHPGTPPNAEAVAIARRSGRFEALAVLPPGNLLDAFGAALLHGASGIGVEAWGALRNNAVLRGTLAAALANWRASGCLTDEPRPTTAILYEPFAESYPQPSPLRTGYLVGTNTGELEPLLTAFRQGTTFGQLGFLAREDLADRSRLAGYRVLLCPMALSLSSADIQALFRFAEGGGVVVADVGFGCSEAGGQIFSWNTELASLLGVLALHPPMSAGGNLRVYEKTTLFPSIPAGSTSVARGGRSPFDEPLVMIRPMEKSTVFAAAADATTPGKPLFGGVLAHPIGKGWVVYASLKLWHRWSPADPLYQLFHRDLMAREPAVALQQAPFLGGTVQVAAFEDGLAARNTAPRNQLVTLETKSEYLYAGSCLNIVRPATAEGIWVAAGLAGGSLGLYERTPIRCVTGQGSATVAVEAYGPAGIKLVVCGGHPRISLNADGVAVMAPSYAQTARILIGDGRYPVRPGSLHLLRAKGRDGGKLQELRIRVGADARIEINNSFYCDVLSLTPLPDETPAAPVTQP